jgi:hypothetical protein
MAETEPAPQLPEPALPPPEICRTSYLDFSFWGTRDPFTGDPIPRPVEDRSSAQ